MPQPQVHHMWTKDEIKKIFRLWENSNPQDLADQLGVKLSQLKNVVTAMRKVGFPLVQKRRNGAYAKVLNEVKRELGIE